MRTIIAIAAAGALLLVASGPVGAAPFSPIRPSADSVSSIQLVATKKKSETVTQKVERVWKDLVGYKFNVSCVFAGPRTCSETGSSRSDALNKCIAKNGGCWVSDAH